MEPDQKLVHQFPTDSKISLSEEVYSYGKSGLIFTVAIVLGVITGFAGNSIKAMVSPRSTSSQTTSAPVQEAVGIPDKKTFKDSAEGLLREGGIDGEGSFHLKRPGGESQNVYLTSSTVDLSEYIGKKVRVHGETFTAEKAGWLMDVGFVEVLK